MANNQQNQNQNQNKNDKNRQGQGRGWHGDSKGHAEAGRQSHKND